MFQTFRNGEPEFTNPANENVIAEIEQTLRATPTLMIVSSTLIVDYEKYISIVEREFRLLSIEPKVQEDE